MIDALYLVIEPVIFEMLDLNWKVALPYIPKRFVDEIKGMADGSNGFVDE